MELNIIKLREKLSNINNNFNYLIDTDYGIATKNIYYTVDINNLVYFLITDREIENKKIDFLYISINSFYFNSNTYNCIKNILDFIQDNEQTIKTAIIESIE